MRHRLITAIAAAGLAISLSPAVANAGPIRIDRVQYDSPGDDTGSNPSLNAEWVVLKNFGNRAKQLRGWTIRDQTGHVYRFGTFKLRPGRSVKIHTGSGTNSRRDRYWRQDAYVWNNDGDKATLKNKGGTRMDTCNWGDGDGDTNC